jgi:hypothetical protein
VTDNHLISLKIIQNVDKSENCVQNKHDLCEGDIIIESNTGSKTTNICKCQCHDNMYQLIQRMQAVNSQ